jgi:hypothetical protein
MNIIYRSSPQGRAANHISSFMQWWYLGVIQITLHGKYGLVGKSTSSHEIWKLKKYQPACHLPADIIK